MTKIKKLDYKKYPHLSKESDNVIIFQNKNNVTKFEALGNINIYEEENNIVDTQTEFPYEMQKQILEGGLIHCKDSADKLNKAIEIASKQIPINDNKSHKELTHKSFEVIEYNIQLNLLSGDLTDKDKEGFYNFLRKETTRDVRIKDAYIRIFKDYIKNIEKASKQTEKLIKDLKKDKKYHGQPTYRSVINSTKGKQEGNLMEIENKGKEKSLNLLANLVNNDKSLSQEERTQVLKDIDKASSNNDLVYEISSWLGNKLTKQERRLLRVLRYIAYKNIQEDVNFKGEKLTMYEVEIPTAEIYAEWGLSRRKSGGYNNSQTQSIRDLFFGVSGKGLFEDILFKHKTITRTRYILQAEAVYSDVKKEESQISGIKIILPGFLFVFDEDIKDKNDTESYVYLDTQGFIRFMKPKGMVQNLAAFELAEYLEVILSSQLEKKLINLQTMLFEAGLKDIHNTRPSKAINKINAILDKMVQAEFLIKSWRFDEKGGKYNQGQYELENIRSKLFSQKKIHKAIKSRKQFIK